MSLGPTESKMVTPAAVREYIRKEIAAAEPVLVRYGDVVNDIAIANGWGPKHEKAISLGYNAGQYAYSDFFEALTAAAKENANNRTKDKAETDGNIYYQTLNGVC